MRPSTRKILLVEDEFLIAMEQAQLLREEGCAVTFDPILMNIDLGRGMDGAFSSAFDHAAIGMGLTLPDGRWFKSIHRFAGSSAALRRNCRRSPFRTSPIRTTWRSIGIASAGRWTERFPAIGGRSAISTNRAVEPGPDAGR